MKVLKNHSVTVSDNENAVFTVETKSYFTRGQRTIVATDAVQGSKTCPGSNLVKRKAVLGLGLPIKTRDEVGNREREARE